MKQRVFIDKYDGTDDIKQSNLVYTLPENMNAYEFLELLAQRENQDTTKQLDKNPNDPDHVALCMKMMLFKVNDSLWHGYDGSYLKFKKVDWWK